MQPNCFLATLSASLAANGSETEAFLSNITTLTGETITTAQFSTMGRGVLTIDPLSSVNIEFAGFTGVDATGIGFTGLQRGLSALNNSSITANKKYHPAGTQVILAWGVHNLLDFQTYINNLVAGGVGNSSNTAAGTIFSTASNAGARPRALSSLVQQQSTPGMTLLVQPFSLSDQGFDVVYAGASTTTYTAPVSNPRIDLLVYNANTAAIAYRTGSESASPSKPTPTQYDIVLASIYHTVGETSIKDTSDGTNGYILSWYYPSVYNANLLPSGSLLDYAGRSTPQGYLPADGSAVSRSTYANLLAAIAPSQTATITNASPAVVTATAHGLVAGDTVHFTTTGSLPSGLNTGVAYYVIAAGLTTNAFELALSPAGTAINTSTAGSGTHTVYKSNFGIGDGSSTFNVPDLRSKGRIGTAASGATVNITMPFDTTCVGTNTITVPNLSYPSQGQIVTLTGTLPTGLSTATNYYVQRTSSTQIKLASTQALANSASADLTFTTTGMSGVCAIVYTTTTNAVIGRAFGEETHGVATTELAAHTHTVVAPNGSGGADGYSSGSSANLNQISGSTGGNGQHNIYTPVVCMPIYIKI